MWWSKENVCAFLQRRAPNIKLDIQDDGVVTKFFLPIPDGADYSLYIDTDIYGYQIAIMATLLRNPNAVFWGYPIDIECAPDMEEAEAQFFEAASAILNCKTRVVQKAGWFIWSFTGEYLQDGHWNPLSSSCYSYDWAKQYIHDTSKRITVYSSPPIIDACK